MSDRIVLEFIQLGRELMSCDWAAHYGQDIARVAPSPPGIAYAQPGFVGGDYLRVVFVGQNPGVGDRPERARASRLWDVELKKWHHDGTLGAFRNVFRFWQNDLQRWPVWSKWMAPVLSRVPLTEENIGYLNLCKNQTTANRSPTARMYQADWIWTKRQLDVLEPKVVVAGGLAVARQIVELWPNPPFKLVRQNRVRSQSNVEIAREAARIATEIREQMPS